MILRTWRLPSSSGSGAQAHAVSAIPVDVALGVLPVEPETLAQGETGADGGRAAEGVAKASFDAVLSPLPLTALTM